MLLQDKIKQQEEEAKNEGISSSSNSEWFALEEGDNNLRILTSLEMIFQQFLPHTRKYEICYTDCGYQGTPKFMAWVIDHKDEQLKIAKLPYTVGQVIAKYQTDEDWKFEDFPMPYDVKINAKNAGTKEVEYTVTPRPVRQEVEPWVIEELKKKTPIADIIAKMKENQKQKHVEDGTWQKAQDKKAQLKEKLDPIREAAINAQSDPNYPKAPNPDDIPF